MGTVYTIILHCTSEWGNGHFDLDPLELQTNHAILLTLWNYYSGSLSNILGIGVDHDDDKDGMNELIMEVLQVELVHENLVICKSSLL